MISEPGHIGGGARRFFSVLLLLVGQGCMADERAPVSAAAVRLEGLPASTLLVTDEEQLAGAARLSAKTDLNILIDRRITINRGVQFPSSRSIVRLIGVTEDAGIHFNMVFDGNWERPGLRPENGLEFRCRQAIIRGLAFTGYEWLGSAIKGHTKELLDVSDCDFREIGTIQFAARVETPTNANDTLFNQCIGAHKMVNGHVSVVDCRFNRCVLNNRRWSHCIYVSARSVLITGNTFTECGSAFAVGGQVPGGSNNVFGNTIAEPQLVSNPQGMRLPTYLCDLYADDFSAFMFNSVSGALHEPWTGQPRSRRQIIDFNNYGEMRYTGKWAADTGEGRYVTWEQWRAAGFDNHSATPTRLPGPPVAEPTGERRQPTKEDSAE